MPRQIQVPSEAEEKLTQLERAGFAAEGRIRELNASVKRARSEAEEWRERFENLLALKRPVRQRPLLGDARRAGALRGVAAAMWSDWHMAERIEAEKVRGLNSFNPETAERRAEKCTESTARLFRHVAKSYSVDTLLLFLGGDFITGYLHPELEQTNYMGPIEEARFAKRVLARCIERLAGTPGLRRLHIVCQRGNHGRTTKKMQFKNDFETSYETWLYTDLEQMLADGKRMVFEIPKSDVHCVELMPGYRLRMFHGHQVRYMDGVGGVTIPLNKWLAKQDKTQRAEHNFMGHFHQYDPMRHTDLNGSLKGYDEYAASAGFAYQPPLQAFTLFDADRRMAVQRMPIFCE